VGQGPKLAPVPPILLYRSQAISHLCQFRRWHLAERSDVLLFILRNQLSIASLYQEDVRDEG